eukprot:4872175-Amphidinium_carterae.2
MLVYAVEERSNAERRAAAQYAVHNWRKWAKIETQAGSRAVHRWLKKDATIEKDPEVGGLPRADGRGLQAILQKWQDVWAVHQNRPLPHAVLSSSSLPLLTAQHIYRACCEYPLNKAVGGDCGAALCRRGLDFASNASGQKKTFWSERRQPPTLKACPGQLSCRCLWRGHTRCQASSLEIIDGIVSKPKEQTSKAAAFNGKMKGRGLRCLLREDL